MSPIILLSIIIVYFALLLWVAYRTGKGSDNDSFFIGNRKSNWMLVAFGMIGTSLSGVTFVSVPGAVGNDKFAYLQITLGYLIGYIVIAYVLLPLYYRLKLTSIYGYLQQRMGQLSYKSGAWIFIVSRLVGATARLYLVVNILQVSILDSLGVPFIVTTLIILAMIILYTYEGGVKTIVWTDTLQTSCMLLGLIICTIYMLNHLGLNVGESFAAMNEKGYTKIFDFDPNQKSFFIKQILAGAFITITMTGIDQEMMQKSLSVTRLKDSQKNMVTLGFILLGVISLFLYMGGLLHLYGAQENVASAGDQLFPDIALNHMPPFISIIFIIALISALFPSADGAMTALTSSLCIDVFGMKEKKDWDDKKKEKFRKNVHLLVALSFLIMVIIFKVINDNSMIGLILKLAGFTYGPLLGLFAFGIFTKYKVKDQLVPFICIAAPVISFFIDKYQETLFGEFKIGLELLIINGLLTFLGLWLIRKK
ncbi:MULTISPECIES: sodium:solute symporter [unclassified Chryseobacterium]|uniref:sodium:solute symporter n=1 Tax=unclassified Chryseobacterium TaxID=2593645 RepID=UPI0012BEE4F7|nr:MULTISPECIES: sodium:solute symporter [unclassified Chryseobacterium]MPS64976.1 sodium:solute symporter [Chryseobacterium sp.]UMQ41308.1 sodium:solute symporter [Chryseobacterium sp. Y16C]